MVKPNIHIAIIILSIGLLISNLAFGQNTNLDSLWQVWSNTNNNDSLRVYSLNLYAYNKYLYLNPDSTINYANIAYTFAKKKGVKSEMASALNTIGIAYKNLGEYDESIKNHLTAINLCTDINHQEYLSMNYSNLANTFTNQTNYSLALEYYYKALEINEKLGFNNYKGANLANIGIIYQEQGENPKAIDAYKKSLKLFELTDNKYGQASVYGNMAVIHQQDGNYEEAIKLNNLALGINKKIEDTYGQINQLINLGVLNVELKKYKIADEIYHQALNLSEQIKDKKSEANIRNNIGGILLDLKEFEKAERYLVNALKINLEIGAKFNLQNDFKNLSSLYEKTNRPKLALQYYKKYITLRDSIQSEENYKATIQQEMQYEYEKQAAIDSIANAKEIEIKEAEIAQQKAEVKAKRNQQYALYGGVGLLLIFGSFIFNRYRITKKQKGIIEKQKAEVDIQKTEAEKQRDIAKKEHIEAELQRHIVEEKNTEILDSIQYAKRLQDAILPPVKLVKEYFDESFILFRPKDIVSGDFYWMESKDNLIMFAAADCTGHGVPGAMVSVVCANALNKSVNELGKTDPADILNSTRQLVIETFSKSGDHVKDGMDISLCVLNEGTQTLHWAGANNPLWIVRRDKNEIETIKPDKQPIGVYGDLLPFTSHRVKIHGGDSIYMFSDGYADQFGGDRGKKMKSGKFKTLLLEHRNENMESQKVALENAFEDWKGDLEQIDDVCVIGVRLKEKTDNPFTSREMEIIQLLDQGRSSKMIAEELSISKATVDTHRRKILGKAGVNSVTELLKFVRDRELL